MDKSISKFLFPGLITLIGLSLVIYSLIIGQNSLFLIGSIALLLTGVIALLSALDIISGNARMIVTIALILGSVGLAYSDYRSIKEPIDFLKEKERRYEQVVQRLKDIRTAQIAYKNVHNTFTDNFDTLISFVKNDSFTVIKAIGNVPDTLTEEEALNRGLISRDTIMRNVNDSIFSASATAGRTVPFNLDELPYIPFTDNAKFSMEIGTISRGSVVVPVILVKDTKPYDPTDVRQFGSLSDPTTNGNWGE